MATETLAPTPFGDISVQDQLALAQAAASTQSDWAKVVELLNKTETQLNKLDKQPKATESLFGLLLTEHNITQSTKRPASQLAHKLYQARIAEVVESLQDSFEEEARALSEIDQINRGEWDDRLLAAVPEAQRAALIAARPSSSNPKQSSPAKQDDKDKERDKDKDKELKSATKGRKPTRRGNRRAGDDDDDAIREEDEGAHAETVPDSDAEVEASVRGKQDKERDKEEGGSARKKDKDKEKEKEGSSPAKGRGPTRKSGRKGRQVEEDPQEESEKEEEEEEEAKEEDEEQEDEDQEDEEQDGDEDEEDGEDEEEAEEEEEPAPIKRGLRGRKPSVSTPAPKAAPVKGAAVGKRTSKRHQGETTASPPATAERSSKRLKTDDPDEGEVTGTPSPPPSPRRRRKTRG